jgi:ElaA protein
MTVVRREAATQVAIAPRIDWTWRRFDDLSVHDVYALLALRAEVFVVEQACPFLDTDFCDQSAWHLLGRVDGELAAYLRALDPGVRYDEPSIGRVVTASRWRGRGLGRTLMIEGIDRAGALWPGVDVVIGAQHRLEAFYRSLGFAREGAIYDEDGIDHIRMRLAAIDTREHRETR